MSRRSDSASVAGVGLLLCALGVVLAALAGCSAAPRAQDPVDAMVISHGYTPVPRALRDRPSLAGSVLVLPPAPEAGCSIGAWEDPWVWSTEPWPTAVRVDCDSTSGEHCGCKAEKCVTKCTHCCGLGNVPCPIDSCTGESR